MARRASRLSGAGSSTPDTRNLDSFPAYTRPVEEQFLQTVLTNTLGSSFYADTKKLVSDTEKVHAAMIEKDPAFMSQAVRYARNKGFMRTQSVYGLAKLANAEKPHFEAAFDGVIRTPNDLADFFAMMKSSRKGEGGRRVKRAAGAWLTNRLSEYWAIKYGAEKQGGYSLADLIKVTHAKGPARPLVDYLLARKGYVFNAEALPQVAAFERLKKATTAAERIQAIKDGRLPHEVASTFAGKDPEVWKAIVGAMPIFAMLRNLATMERLGIMNDVREHVCATFRNEKAIAKSMIFPFRFLEAAKHVSDAKVTDALRDAVDLSFANVPEIPGRTLVFLDISGSMQEVLTQAALFALSAIKKAKEGDLWLFNTGTIPFKFSMRDSVLTQAEKIHTSGGTDVGAPMRHARETGYRADTIICITDEQQNQGSPFHGELVRYRKQVNPEAKCFILNVAPYPNMAVAPSDDPLTYWTYGWSDATLRFISMVAKGWGSLADLVRSGKWDDDEAEPIETAA